MAISIRQPTGERDHRTRARLGARTLVTHVAPVAVVLGGLLAVGGAADAAQGPVGLGTATSFAVLAGSGITNTGATTIRGDVGSYDTAPTAETGFGPGANAVTFIPPGVNHGGDGVTAGAKGDLVTAYNDAAGRNPATTVANQLGGTTLLAGVYNSLTGPFLLTGTLSLDAKGDPAAEFIFQTPSTLTTATDSHVLLLNGANPCHVVWQIGSSATFGIRSQFVGDVLALTSITATTNATFEGRLLARNGAVTLDTNTITNANCAAPVFVPPPTAAPTTSTSTTTAPTTSTTAAPTTSTTAVPTTSTTAAPRSTTTTASPVGTIATPGGTGPAGTGPLGIGSGTPGAGAPGTSSGGVITGSPGTAAGGPGITTTATPTTTGLAFTGLRAMTLGIAGLGAILFGTLLLVATRRPSGGHYLE